MPYCKVRLSAKKPGSVSGKPQSLGEHLRHRRWELGLFQKDAAKRLQIDAWTLGNWEKDKTVPAVRFLPRIIAFLGYDPYPAPETIAETLVAHRRRHGLSRTKQATLIGIDEGVLLRVERSQECPSGKCGERIRDFLAAMS